MVLRTKIYLSFLSVFFFLGCQKTLVKENDVSVDKSMRIPNNFFKELPVPGIEYFNVNENSSHGNNAAANPGPGDSIEPNNGDLPIILGNQLPNPYTIKNMRKAYYELYGTWPQIICMLDLSHQV